MQKYFEKIKEQIEEKSCEFVEATVTDTMLPVRVAIEIVNQVAEEVAVAENATTNDGWIPCSERIPVEPIFSVDSYLVQQSDVITPYSAYWDGMCWSDREGETLDKIVAWQPLPAPYQPKGEEK